MKIVDLVCSKGRTGFYFDDQKAIREGAKQNGFMYDGTPATEGFSAVRQAGESISVMLILDDGQVAFGDCAAVQYSGAGGRDPLFLADDYIPVIEREFKPLFVGKEVNSFKELAMLCDDHIDSATNKPMHTAIRYGMSQALLDAVAKAKKTTMAHVLADEFGTEVSAKRIPIFCQSGDDRRLNADKMIVKTADVLPHGLFNNTEKLGKDGAGLKEYISWLSARISEMKPKEDYHPIIHIDVYGTIGFELEDNFDKIVELLRECEELAKPYKLNIEGPVDLGSREKQIEGLAELCRRLKEENIDVGIVADEWCNSLQDVKDFADAGAGDIIQIKTPDLGSVHNSLEAILYCKEKGVGTYIGGTCNETDRSAQVCVHVSMAGHPDQLLAKPGMGVDEGYMIINNEMNRILALDKAINNFCRSR